jgi:Tfp pilus assembly protein PilX
MSRRRLAPVAARARDQRGLAVVMVLMVMLIGGLLASAVVAAAMFTNSSTNRDSNLKAAVAAADAGLDAATYRLNMVTPSAGTASCSLTNPTDTQCGPETLGNGASYSFWTSSVLSSSAACAGLQVTNSQSTVSQRCITAIGTAHGISARVQARVGAFTTTPAFQFPLLGLNYVNISQNDTISALTPPVTGTNGQLTVGNNAGVTGCELGAGAPPPLVGNGATTGGSCQVSPNTFYIPPVNTTASLASNDDQRIMNGLNRSCASGSYCDPSSGGVAFNASTRVLNLSNNSSLTLGGGVYNFCNLTASNGSVITVAANTKVQIYIDSPTDSASGCAAGTGYFTLSQGVTWYNASQDPTNLQIWVYGPAPVSFYNNSNSYLSLYAPQSDISISGSNNTLVDGAIGGLSVTIKNVTTFTYDARDAGITLQTNGHYYRSAWEQCPAVPSNPSDPTSGC